MRATDQNGITARGESGRAIAWPRTRRGRRRLIVATILAVTAIAAMIVFYRPLFEGNFGVVQPGLVYRSAQPKDGLESFIATYQPRSILNLRGGSYRDDWYKAEVDATESHDIAFYDYPISATHRPTRKQMLTLLDVIDKAPYPMLIHCKQGADRTGLVSALYLMMKQSTPPGEARRALTIWHGHVPLFGTGALHGPLTEYQRWLETQQAKHTPDQFRQWLIQDYQDPDNQPPGDERHALRPGPRWEQMPKMADRTSGSKAAQPR